MSRVKRGTIKNKRRKNVLSMTKGYRLNRRSKEASAIEAIMHAGANAFEGKVIGSCYPRHQKCRIPEISAQDQPRGAQWTGCPYDSG